MIHPPTLSPCSFSSRFARRERVPWRGAVVATKHGPPDSYGRSQRYVGEACRLGGVANIQNRDVTAVSAAKVHRITP